MSTLNVSEVTRIATEAAQEQSARLQVVGVTIGGGDGDYAEVIIDVEGCAHEPCRLSMGIFRTVSAEALHDEIAGKLQLHMQHHGN